MCMEILKRHWIALIFALGIGVVTVSPFVYFQTTAGYQGISMMGTDAEDHYLARMQEVYDGYPSQGNVFLPDKTVSPIEPGLGEWLEAQFGKALHLSVSQAETAGKFILPFTIALLIYALAYTLSASRAASALASIAVMLGDPFVSNPRLLIELLHSTVPQTSFLIYARPVSPEMSAIFLFGTLLILARLFFTQITVMSRGRRVAALVAVAVLTGLSLYVSFYTFAFLGALELVMFLSALFRRKYSHALELGSAGLGGLILAIPFVINYLHIAAAPAYASASERFGFIATRAPVFGALVFILIAAALFIPNRLQAARTFFLYGAAALILILNQQLITDHVLQAGHFHWYVTRPFVCIAGAILFSALVARFVRHKIISFGLYGLVCGVLIYGAVLVQIGAYRAVYPVAHAAQTYASLLASLNATSSPQVVWANRDLSSYVSIYTHDDAPNDNYAEYYLIPEQYLVTRLFLEYRLRGVTPANVREVMTQDRADISARLFGVYWRDAAGSYAAIPGALLDKYAQEYKDTYAESIPARLASLDVTTVIWDTKADPEWNLNATLSMIPKRVGRFEVFQLMNQKP